jgi:hypothetical protein
MLLVRSLKFYWSCGPAACLHPETDVLIQRIFS